MFQREREALDNIAANLAQSPSVLKAVAYGSRIRGEERADSELVTGLSFSVAILSRAEASMNERLGSLFFKRVMVEGLVFYDAESRRKDRPIAVQAG